MHKLIKELREIEQETPRWKHNPPTEDYVFACRAGEYDVYVIPGKCERPRDWVLDCKFYPWSWNGNRLKTHLTASEFGKVSAFIDNNFRTE